MRRRRRILRLANAPHHFDGVVSSMSSTSFVLSQYACGGVGARGSDASMIDARLAGWVWAPVRWVAWIESLLQQVGSYHSDSQVITDPLLDVQSNFRAISVS